MDQYTPYNPTLDAASDAPFDLPCKPMLSQSEEVALCRALASQHDVRALFERDPAQAMAQLGIPIATIESLPPKCREVRQLAPKEAFQALLEDINGQAFLLAMTMRQPNIK